MRRRDFLKLVGIAAGAVPFRAEAQEKHFRIGLISAAPPTPEMLRAFRDAMRERGYIEGQNVAFDVRWPKGALSDDPDAVTHLVKGNFDVIVAWATPTVAAVRRQTSSIPIVMVSVGDPVGAGFVASLARPGGNITGVSISRFSTVRAQVGELSKNKTGWTVGGGVEWNVRTALVGLS